jgi:hypothetical protein
MRRAQPVDFSRKLAKLLWKSRLSMSDINKSRSAEKAHERFVAKRLRQMETDHLESHSLWKNSKLEAAIVRDKNFSKWVELRSHETLTLALDMKSARARSWVRATLARILKVEPKKKFRVVLSGDQIELQTSLEKRGLTLEDRYLVGDTAPAFVRLREHLNTRRSLDLPAGIRICDLTSLDEARQIIRLKRKVFRLQPEYCWFGMFPEYLKSEHEELREFLKLRGNRRHARAKVLVLKNSKGKVLGFGSVFFYKADKLFRRCGGMDYCFDRSLQGQGLGTLVFYELLKALRERRVPIFTGHTSNPAVRRLGVITQRRVEQVFLRNF